MSHVNRHTVRQPLALVVVSTALMWVVISVLPGISVSAGGSVLLATLIVAGMSALMRPVLARVATWLGWLGVVLVGLFAQAVIFYAALSVAPDISVSGFWPAFWASWLYALLVGTVGWV